MTTPPWLRNDAALSDDTPDAKRLQTQPALLFGSVTYALSPILWRVCNLVSLSNSADLDVSAAAIAKLKQNIDDLDELIARSDARNTD
jgi:hypothetical protein